MSLISKHAGGNFHKPYANKHVTIACDTCRRRRRKCDGQAPCLLCRSTEELCLYTSVDRRRQRHDNDESKVFRIDGANTNPIPQQDAQYPGSNSEGYPASGLQKPASQEPQPTYNAEAIPFRGSQAKFRTLASKSSDHIGKASVSKTHAMKDMQGLFEVRAEMLQHQPETDLRSFPHQRSLPIDSASTHGIDVRDRVRKHNRTGSRQQPYQIVWQARRARYAAPGYTRTFGNLPFSSSIKTNGYSASIQAHQIMNFSTPEHLVFPLLDVDESPLGRAIIDFRRLGQRLIAKGMPPSQIADRGLIDVTLFFRERLPQDPVNASTWASEMLRAFRGTFSDQLLLACAIGVTSLMRWFLEPTPESYNQIPAIMRPTHLQRFKPHPPWIDVMIFPSFRNALINKLRDWVEPCMKAEWNLSWSGSLEQALIRHGHTQQIFLTSDFASYISNPQNWSMRRSILEDFSELQGSEINISQE